VNVGRKSFFVESKTAAFDNSVCDKCGLRIKDIQDGKGFWNPNPKAIDRNICRNCYDVWKHDREARWKTWQEKHAALISQLPPAVAGRE
jgi:hypothetical protein